MTSGDLYQLLERIASSLDRIEHLLDKDNSCPARAEPGISRFHLETCAPEQTQTPQNESELVELFLDSRNIQIKVKKPEDAADAVIDRLSLFVGERYQALKGILMKIKRSMQTGGYFSEHIAKMSQDDISSVCQFCSRLHELALLEQYKYFRSPQYLIRAKATTLPKAQAFFGGQWLERFTLQRLKKAHSIIQAEIGESISFQYLINPQVILSNGDDFELDVIAVVGKSPIWIEAKSGDYQQHVQKYSRLARQFGLDYAHCMMVLTDVVDEQCEALSSLFLMTVVNLNQLQNQLLETLRNDHSRA